MPRQRQSGYARLAQAEEEERGQGLYDDSDDDDVFSSHEPLSATTTRYAAIQPPARDRMRIPAHDPPNGHPKRPATRKRMRSNSSGVDIKAINARLEKWAEEIASKFKIGTVKGKSPEEEHLEIHHSVFQAPDGIRPATAETLALDAPTEDGDRISKVQFDDVVESVRIAIEMGVHPKMISQGSSGSYFARNTDGKVVGVFKPKDEEPYASRNPKWTKWIHRNLFPCFFGRACLIPNLSYVSEAAAYVLDAQLRTNLVPYTDIVYLSSKSFYYDFWDRRSTWGSKKSLPAKVGSFQVFLKGYKDANVFLREHPWPDQANSGFNAEDIPSKKKRPPWSDCRPGGAQSDDEEESHPPISSPTQEEPSERAFYWSSTLKQAFREELEKLVILDYIMRNTDRGLDNWMIKVDWHNEEVSIVSEPPRLNGAVGDPSPPARPVSVNAERPISNDLNPYRRHEAMSAESRSATPSNHQDGASPSISIGAIDNSLSWPWKHPDAVSSVANSHEMTLILTLNYIVAEFSIWLAILARISDRAALLEENTGPLSPSSDVHRLVERYANRTPQSLCTGL
jgi:phosphatidylinositol 4-kinase type 2